MGEGVSIMKSAKRSQFRRMFPIPCRSPIYSGKSDFQSNRCTSIGQEYDQIEERVVNVSPHKGKPAEVSKLPTVSRHLSLR